MRLPSLFVMPTPVTISFVWRVHQVFGAVELSSFLRLVVRWSHLNSFDVCARNIFNQRLARVTLRSNLNYNATRSTVYKNSLPMMPLSNMTEIL
jgi:hypothetical protein